MKKLLALFVLFILNGCLSHPQPSVASFLLQAPVLDKAALPLPYTVQILPIKVAAPYADKTFIYRVDAQRYEVDFYHRFLSYPSHMLTEAVRASISQSHLFKNVLSARTVQEADFLLEITVTALYADYQAQPAAVLTLQAYFSQSNQHGEAYLLNQTFTARVPLSAKNPLAYTQAMNTALAQTLQQLQGQMYMAISKADKINIADPR